MYTNIETIYTLFQQSSGIVIDSRKICADSMFFALKGTQTDGNRFAESAVQQGALAAIVDDPQLKDTKGCFLVEDVLTTLQELARHHRKTFTFPVIGLTGSNGKTTSKELLHAVLSSTFSVAATQGNLNNHIGVPLTILSVRQNPDYLIVEMGANHQGEIAFLSGISNPDYGFITNIGKAHLEGQNRTLPAFTRHRWPPFWQWGRCKTNRFHAGFFPKRKNSLYISFATFGDQPEYNFFVICIQ
jgi:UDP-N-acetylmuramoyl-tripeptide--D-alanyl-D-alanine ligase